MKKQIKNYTFSASTRQITFTDYLSIDLDGLLLITNVTNNVIIYNFANALSWAETQATGSVLHNVLTLTYDTSTMSDSDDLQIFYDAPEISEATDESLQEIVTAIEDINNTSIIDASGLPLSRAELNAYKMEDEKAIFTQDANLEKVFGSQPLTNQGKIKVEGNIPPEQIIHGVMGRLNEEVKINLTGQGTVTIQLVGTWAGTMTFYGTVDGQNWVAFYGEVPGAIIGLVLNTTVNGVFRFHTAGLLAFKVQFTTYTSGSARAILVSTSIGMAFEHSVVSGSQGSLLQQRPSSLEQSTHDTAVREAFYMTESWNPNLIYFPGDIVKWNGKIYRCIVQTANGISSSYAPGTGYWTLEIRPERSLVTNALTSSPELPRLRIELDLDAYQYRLAETQMLNQQIQILNDLISTDYELTIEQNAGGMYVKNFALGRSSSSYYGLDEPR